jgi:hypothetical protein
MHDLVVVLPGIMGSTLARDGKAVWAPSAGAVVRAVLRFGRDIKRLQLPAGVGDDHPGDGVEPVGLMPDLHVLPGLWSANIGYGVLVEWLRTTHALDDGQLLPFPYDWRLSNRYNGRRLGTVVEPALERLRARGGPFADAKVTFIAHSMGGLVARWYIECEGGWAITSKLITLGTPFRGALNALDQLVNGVRKGIGPLKLELTPFARSLPSVHQLLPEYACIEGPGGLLRTTETSLPDLEGAMVADAMAFHTHLDDAAAARGVDAFDLHPLVGIRQPTRTTARLIGGVVETVLTIDGNDEAGDATVPRLSAAPKSVEPDSSILRFIADQHGSLQSNRAVLDELDGVLTANPVVHRDLPPVQVGIDVEELLLAGEPIVVHAVHQSRDALLGATLLDERGVVVAKAPLVAASDGPRVTLPAQPPGAYQVVVDDVDEASGRVSPVTAPLLVWDPAVELD